MILIKLRNGMDWFYANAVFRQLVEDAAEMFPGEVAANHELMLTQAFGTLDCGALEEGMSKTICDVLSAVARATLRTELAGWLKTNPDDHAGQTLYLLAVRHLLNCIEADGQK